MDVWSLQRDAARPAVSAARPRAGRPILRAQMRALRRNLLLAERSSPHHRVLAADLLQARRPQAGR
jgi:hypothetical protein